MTDTQNNLHVLSTEDSESDLGILFKKNLKFDEHIDNTVNKVNRIIGLIKRKFTYMDKDLFLTGIAIYRKERSFRGRKVASAEGRFLYGRKLLNKFISKIIL